MKQLLLFATMLAAVTNHSYVGSYGSDSVVKAASLPPRIRLNDFINNCSFMIRIHLTLMIVFNVSLVTICL